MELLLCIHVNERTEYSKSTYQIKACCQISGGIWSVNETDFTGFGVD